MECGNSVFLLISHFLVRRKWSVSPAHTHHNILCHQRPKAAGLMTMGLWNKLYFLKLTSSSEVFCYSNGKLTNSRRRKTQENQPFKNLCWGPARWLSWYRCLSPNLVTWVQSEEPMYRWKGSWPDFYTCAHTQINKKCNKNFKSSTLSLEEGAGHVAWLVVLA